MQNPTNDASLAIAQKLQVDAGEVAGIVMEWFMAAAEREGRPVNQSDIGELIALFLAAAWECAKRNLSDDPVAGATRYANLLRSHADHIEQCSGNRTA